MADVKGEAHRIKGSSLLFKGLLGILPHLTHTHGHLLFLQLGLINGVFLEHEAHHPAQAKQQQHVI